MALYNKNGLTHKQQMFADEWLIDGNATRSYKKAYPNTKKDVTAKSNGAKLLTNHNLKAYIAKRQAEMQERANVDQDWLLDRYIRLSDYTIADFFNDDYTLKPISEIPAGALYAIEGLDVSTSVSMGADENLIETVLKKFKLPGKKGTLDSIGKLVGLLVERKKIENDVKIEHKLSPEIQAKLDEIYGAD